MNLMISILVIAGLLFGGGATVNAAQDDLPNEPLYSLKMWTEDLSLQARSDPDQKVDRLMELAQVRIQEMTRLADAGQFTPDAFEVEAVNARLLQLLEPVVKVGVISAPARRFREVPAKFTVATCVVPAKFSPYRKRIRSSVSWSVAPSTNSMTR